MLAMAPLVTELLGQHDSKACLARSMVANACLASILG